MIKDDPTVLVLSGGLVRGFLHLGALYYLQNHGKLDRVNHYIGTSIGAVIGYLLIIGYKPMEIVSYFLSNDILSSFKELGVGMFNIHKKWGFYSFYEIQKHIDKMTLNKVGYILTLEELFLRFNKTLTCVTYNSTDNRIEHINTANNPKLLCSTALRMTCNVPVLFEKFDYNGCCYIDGGIVQNFPIIYAAKHFPNESILGLNLIRDRSVHDSTIIEYCYRIARIPSDTLEQYQISKLEKYPNVQTIDLFMEGLSSLDFNIDVSKIMEIFSKGYNTVKLNDLDSNGDNSSLDKELNGGEEKDKLNNETEDGVNDKLEITIGTRDDKISDKDQEVNDTRDEKMFTDNPTMEMVELAIDNKSNEEQLQSSIPSDIRIIDENSVNPDELKIESEDRRVIEII